MQVYYVFINFKEEYSTTNRILTESLSPGLFRPFRNVKLGIFRILQETVNIAYGFPSLLVVAIGLCARSH